MDSVLTYPQCCAKEEVYFTMYSPIGFISILHKGADNARPGNDVGLYRFDQNRKRRQNIPVTYIFIFKNNVFYRAYCQQAKCPVLIHLAL
jgi:hypothetical protein